MDFGARLKQLRTDAGLTQKQLATMIGVTKSVISFYEQQERSPSPEVLKKIAVIFHVSADYLLGLDAKEQLDLTGLEHQDIVLLRTMADRLRK